MLNQLSAKFETIRIWSGLSIIFFIFSLSLIHLFSISLTRSKTGVKGSFKLKN
jgi:thiol:disulfide interchange protein